MNEQEQRLRELNAEIKELSFEKGKRDNAKLAQLRDEAVKVKNRINLADKKLLRLEATTALKNVLEREKKYNDSAENSIVEPKYARRKKYWYPNISADDMLYIKRRAQNEVNNDNNYIDENTKWLYNEKNGKKYFALYSSVYQDNPTILYASNGE